MKSLRYILMVNWWLFEEPVVVELTGNGLLYGANGAGKSSIFDAIQAVFVGGDAGKLRFNQRADEGSRRTLRSYCLGIATTDPEEGKRSVDLDPRSSSLTHLVLTFEDEKGTYYNAGLLLSASEGNPKADVEERYTFVGPRILPEHLVGPRAALDAKELKGALAALEERALRQMRSRQPKFKTHPTATLYQREFAAMLSGPGGLIDSQRLIKAFLAALHFKTENDIDSFIRKQILEEYPMSLEKMRRSLSDYRIIREKVEECIKRLESLRAINKLYTEAHERERKRDQYLWAAAEATCLFEQIDAMMAEDRVDARLRDKAALEKVATDTEGKILVAEQQRNTLREQLAAHREDSRLTAVEEQIKGAIQRVEMAEKTAASAMQNWNHLHLLTSKNEAPADLRLNTSRLCGIGNIFLGGGLPTEAEVGATSSRVLQESRRWHDDLKAQSDRHRDLRNTSRQQMEDLQERLDRLSSGGLDLPPEARELLRALASRQIEATPVCSLIEVGDPDWREAIEAHLGGARFSVIVRPEHVSDAYRVLRTAGVHGRIRGVRVFDTRKADAFLSRLPVSDSVASRLRTDSKLARAWIYNTLGGIRMAEDEQEQREKGRSLTKDGVYYDGSHFIIAKRATPALGKGATEVLLPILKEDLRKASGAMNAAATALAGVDALWTELGRVNTRLEDQHQVGQAMQQAVKARNELAGFRSALESITNPETKRLRDQVVALQAKIDSLGGDLKNERALAEAARGKAAEAEAERQTIAARCTKASNDRAMVDATPGLERSLANQILGDLQERFQDLGRQSSLLVPIGPGEERHGDLRVEFFQNKLVSQEASKKSAEQAELAKRKLAGAQEQLAVHRTLYKVEGLPSDATDSDRELWTLAELNRIESDELHNYQAQAKLAQETVAKVIRGDFSGHLILARKQMQTVLNERNTLLRSHTFSNGERYRFVANPVKEFAKIGEWLDSIERQDAAREYDATESLGLFSDNKFKEAQDKVMELLEQAGDLPTDRLAITDYRSYYSFDMLVDSPTAGVMSVQKRLSSASGGERFTPLYIAVATALCGAYRIERPRGGHSRSGGALALFDEAFNNLDADNIDSCMGVLLGVGLQVVIACPDEKAPTLRQYADTHLKMIKDGGTAVVQRTELTELGKETLRTDFPEELRSFKSPVPEDGRPPLARAGAEDLEGDEAADVDLLPAVPAEAASAGDGERPN